MKNINIRNLKLTTLLFILAVSLLGVLLSPPVTLAATGDNCSVDLTSSVSDTQNWNNITILKGSDGYAWRRGTISNPVDALYLKEGQASDISALTDAKAPTQFFIYAANETTPGVLNKPGEGICFEGPVADDAGVATFSINARAVWGNLGKKLVLDVFYRLPQKYDELSGSTTNDNAQKQSLQIYTFLLPRVVDVKLLIASSPKSNNSLQGNSEWKSSNDDGGVCKEPGGPPKKNLDLFNNTVDIGNTSSTPNIEKGKFETLITGSKDASGCWKQGVLKLDPSQLDSNLLSTNFDNVGGNTINISRYGMNHTFMSGIGSSSIGASNPGFKEVQLITIKALVMETLKSMMQGGRTNPDDLSANTFDCQLGGGPGWSYSPPGIPILSEESLKSALSGGSGVSPEIQQFVKNVHDLLTGNKRQAASAYIAQEVEKTIKANNPCLDMADKVGAGQLLPLLDVPFKPEIYDQLLPASGSNEENWADNFLKILNFWTGTTCVNNTLLYPDSALSWNFLKGITELGNLQDADTGCGFFTNGISPKLLLNTTEPITLAPDFRDTTIVYSGKEFDSTNNWSLPAGKKLPLDYRYNFIQPFTKERSGKMCVRKDGLPKLVSSIQKSYHLTSEETGVLSQELTVDFPTTSDFVKISLANPQDIAARFSWLGNGKPLSILQLFFDFTPGACSSESLTAPVLNIPANRDGFEVGILQ